MGQQQLLLIVLGVLIIGIAVVVGVNFFLSYSIDTKRNNIINEGITLASIAQEYYRKPVNMNGGGNTFSGWAIPIELKRTANGQYSEAVSEDSVVITGRGNEIITADVPVEVNITIKHNSFRINIIH